ncbi:MAG: hypothetical protein WD960_05155 [Gemmatimonadota bacterium]
MSGLVVGFLLMTAVVGWVLHPIFARQAASLPDDGIEGSVPLHETRSDRGVEAEIAALRTVLREGQACGRCGVPILEDDHYCGGCGAPMDAPDGPPTNAD